MKTIVQDTADEKTKSGDLAMSERRKCCVITQIVEKERVLV